MSLQDTLKSKAATQEAAIKEEVIIKEEEKKEILPVNAPAYYESLSVRYYGDYRILASNCLPIPKIGDMYTPQDEDQVECLEYQFEQNRITKEIV